MEFTQPAEARSPVHLSAEAVLLPAALSRQFTSDSSRPQWTRGYNGGIPGPTIRVAPGEVLHVHLDNNLGVEGMPLGENGWHALNATNLHTHGLHTSPTGLGDDVQRSVPPGASARFAFRVPPSHMGGTHFYHPHVHGGGTMQAGGGMVGMLIVDDLPGALPAEVAAAEERHLVLTYLRPGSLVRIAREYEASCGAGAGCRDPFWADVPLTDASAVLPLVNGMLNPTMRLDAATWYRLRLLFADSGGAVGAPHSFDFPGDDLRPSLDGCEVGLLAKDGVYLPRAPRPIRRGFMSAGSRADWLVRCPAGRHVLRDEGRGVDLALVLSAPPPSPAAVGEVFPFAVGRPCYLADLSDATVDAQHAMSLSPMSYTIAVDGQPAQKYSGGRHTAFQLPVASVIELSVGGVSNHMYHVFHMHVNPFQLQEDVESEGYFRKGDWHDTLRVPSHGMMGMMGMMGRRLGMMDGVMGHMMGGGGIPVRFQTDNFTGPVMVHCHYVSHQDRGMMVMGEIVGKEGSIFAGAEVLDPRCYRSATPTPWTRIDARELERDTGSSSWPSHDALLGLGLTVGLMVAAVAWSVKRIRQRRHRLLLA